MCDLPPVRYRRHDREFTCRRHPYALSKHRVGSPAANQGKRTPDRRPADEHDERDDMQPRSASAWYCAVGEKVTTDRSNAGLGITATQFFESIGDHHVRRFLDPAMLPTLDAIFGGGIAGPQLRQATRALIDFDALLARHHDRERVLRLLPKHKQVELRGRLGQDPREMCQDDWTPDQLKQLRGFFGLMEEPDFVPQELTSIDIQPAYGLFDHQRRAVSELMPMLTQDERRAVLHLPTGVGKTRTAMHVVANILRTNEPSIVIWLASGEELLQQAVAAFRESWNSLGTRTVKLASMWGNRTPDIQNFSDGFIAVGLTKAWAMLSRRDPDWAARLAPKVRLVIFDEAHQSIAPTFQRITNELLLDYRCALLGLTATPGRTWSDIDEDRKLSEFFAGNKVTLDVPGDNPIEYLTDNGYLARPIFHTLLSEPGIQLEGSELDRIAKHLEIPEALIASLSMSEQYVVAVIDGISKLLSIGHRRILVFAATVDHARMIGAILLARDIRSFVITATTSRYRREQALRIFRSGDSLAAVVVNFGVLTTGFDAPKASAVVIARPTQSLVLYSQMVGRAIRGPKAGGTETCDILTVVDPCLPGFQGVAEAFLNWEDVWS